MAAYKCMKVCESFGPSARVLPTTANFTQIAEFEGDALPVVPQIGRLKLNEVLRTRGKDHVVIVNASHFGNSAVFGKDELVSAIQGGCRAVVILGQVGQVDAMKAARIPILAFGCTPRLLRKDEGIAYAGLLDCEAGLITSSHYIVGDADGVVAVEKEQFQAKFPVKTGGVTP
ncbi:hypothetical protein [uncultured Bosea sp.]|uniref:RraA family protein n=1 Tax=uncultured Bosea sp. TaxID=211457 RepID=UPI0025D0796C|nr:hypothetical protein [uncultured Bosea sp.]